MATEHILYRKITPQKLMIIWKSLSPRKICYVRLRWRLKRK